MEGLFVGVTFQHGNTDTEKSLPLLPLFPGTRMQMVEHRMHKCYSKSRAEKTSAYFLSISKKKRTRRTAVKDMGLLGLVCTLEMADQ